MVQVLVERKQLLGSQVSLMDAVQRYEASNEVKGAHCPFSHAAPPQLFPHNPQFLQHLAQVKDTGFLFRLYVSLFVCLNVCLFILFSIFLSVFSSSSSLRIC